ncbi:MAG: ATP synthase subunit I [Luteimonas sp.]
MHDPIAAGRRTALRAVAVQGLVGIVVALALLPIGQAQALAAAAGGLAMVLGNAASVHLALGGIVPARIALGRLMLGAMAKWLITIAGFAIALVTWRLPPLPMLLGLAAGLLAYLLALNALETGRNDKG